MNHLKSSGLLAFPRFIQNISLSSVRIASVEPFAWNNIQQQTMSSSSTASGLDNLVVEHDPNSKKFFIKLNDAEAKLEYVEEKKENCIVVLDMWHTEVPPALQGKGIAKVLAKEAFEYVVANNLKMQLSCSYLQKYLKDNPLDKYKAVTAS